MTEPSEVVLRSFDAWNAGDLGGWLSLHHPDVVVIPPDGWPESEEPRSREAWRVQAQRLIDSWAEQRIELTRVQAAGERVLVLFEWITRGKGSSIELVSRMALVATVRDGLISRAEYYVDHDEALEAAGVG